MSISIGPSDIFEVLPKRVNLKYQQTTLQYIFSKPSHFEHPFQQTCTTTGAKPTPQSTFFFPSLKNAKWPQMQFLNAVWQPIDTSSRSHRCLDKFSSKPPTPSQDSLSFFSLIQITEINVHQTTKESPGNSVWPFWGWWKSDLQRLGIKRSPWFTESKNTHRSDGSTAKSDESINVVTTEVGRLWDSHIPKIDNPDIFNLLKGSLLVTYQSKNYQS